VICRARDPTRDREKIDKLMRDYFENQDSEIPDQILELGKQLREWDQ
jgi:hypothetical protein